VANIARKETSAIARNIILFSLLVEEEEEPLLLLLFDEKEKTPPIVVLFFFFFFSIARRFCANDVRVYLSGFFLPFFSGEMLQKYKRREREREMSLRRRGAAAAAATASRSFSSSSSSSRQLSLLFSSETKRCAAVSAEKKNSIFAFGHLLLRRDIAGKTKMDKKVTFSSSSSSSSSSSIAAKNAVTKQSFSAPPQKVVARPGVVAADGMPRYPNFTSVPGLLRGADYVGTVSFAMTGTLLAASKGLDCFGAPVVGLITAVGGGTIRDFVLGAGRRAFWMEEQEYVYLALATGAATFFGWEYAKKHFDVVRDDAWWIEASDALGVGAFCVIGCMNGVRAGVSAINCIACGVFTATGGGVVRDVIVGRPPRIFHSYATAYATPAAAGAATYLLARKMGVSTSARIVSGVTVGILGRIASESGNVRLPLYESEEAKANAKMKGDVRD